MATETTKGKGKAKQAGAGVVGQTGILNTLKSEHQEVASLMEKILKAEDQGGDIEELYAELRTKLLLHAKAESEVLYAACEDEDDLADIVAESQREHDEIEDLLMQLDTDTSNEAEWMETFRFLHDSVTQHVEEEEGDLFPQCEEVFQLSSLRDMDEEYQEARERLQSELETGGDIRGEA